MKPKTALWWRRKRKTDSPVWHFEADCPSLSVDSADNVFVDKNPRRGTKCDHCQRLRRKSA